ncbi:hypothetical protein MLD38_005889 [Melastoma candidum]|uniref:Uncharacterized protein n=1 Tax=Melastoma candidum TaxID=119954 RepID=A0ACB9RMB9_9MYRT|nr:hypothetical protein MLD38_005889 [Melastoma candidum]
MKVEVISSKGCSKLLVGFTSAMPSIRGFQMDTAASPAVSSSGSQSGLGSNDAPFSGLVICVTGLSKEARKQVMEATERLGGNYSPDLHPQCTHLVVQSFGGRKFEHALKHGSTNGLFIVSLGWFVESVKRNVRLNESLYGVKNMKNYDNRIDELSRIMGFTGAENSCLPPGIHNPKKPGITEESKPWYSERVNHRDLDSNTLSGHTVYVDSDISADLRNKVIDIAIKEGATLTSKWFVGCSATGVVCEGTSVGRYLGHCSNLITPSWMMKTAKDKEAQGFVHLSIDLARQLASLLDNCQNSVMKKATRENENLGCEQQSYLNKRSLKERQQIVEFAKNAARDRRVRKMQTCQTPIKPITPVCLLDSICWLVSEPTSSAYLYTDTLCSDDGQTPLFYDAKVDGKESKASFACLTRPLTEREKNQLIFMGHFLTILFPIDRFAEMGLSSRTFFSHEGFTCLKVLDHIYEFYQENMSASEIDTAIHTDSRHADRLRSIYASKDSGECGVVEFKRIEFLGSRGHFEMLKRVNGDNNSNVYELLIRS